MANGKPATIPYSAYRRHIARAIQSDRAWRRQQAKLPIERKIAIVVELQTLNYEIGLAQGQERPRPWGTDHD
jgi:hypothetical protein